MGDSPDSNARKFGTFTGVFTPTLLTILGVIMYVRLGWVVGNAGLMGAWLLMLLAMGITACTGLSLSSIATNTRLGAGGPYALISRSLGFEVGGSIGVPLYLSRPLGVAMYIFGFREGWQWVFPDHDPLLIDMIVFVGIFGLAYLSAQLAFRVQYAIMALIAASLVSIFASPETFNPSSDITWWGDYEGFPEDGFQGADFWLVFAVFFPATTGILAGANMSGDLQDPRRSIPVGTLWAIVLSSLIYFALAFWAAGAGSMEELRSNYNLIIDKAFYGPAVLAGLLGATFSSALAGAVGGPRILMAMGEHELLPKSEWLAAKTAKGEPRNAVLLTAGLTLACLMVRDLNVIAPLVTMFFLITYFFINVVLLVESGLGLVSFRPTLRVPILVPLLGAIGCVFVMFVVNPTFALISVGTVIAIYWYLTKVGLEKHGEDVRSSVFVSMAEWSAAKVSEMGTNVRSWRPNLLVPFEDPAQLRGQYFLLLDVTRPEGSVKLLGLATSQSRKELLDITEGLASDFHEDEMFSTWSVVDTPSFTDGVMNSLQALQSAFFRPNVLFLTVPHPDAGREQEFSKVIVQAHETGVGVILLGMHQKAGLGQRRVINVWVRPHRSGWDANLAFDHNNLDLSLLMAYRLMRTWGDKAHINVLTAVTSEDERADAEQFLADVCDLARIPPSATRQVMVGGFRDCVAEAPQSDLNIMGLQENPDFGFMHGMIELSNSSCLFVADSGRESARA